MLHDKEMSAGPILKSYDELFENDGSNILFGLAGSVDLESLHPDAMEIFKMWQLFLDNVHPIIKLFHAPTVQQQILKAASDLGTASPAMHALLFGIYSIAIVSVDDLKCTTTFGASKTTLVRRYQTGNVYALQRAGFLRSSELTVLQALLLYLVSIIQALFVDTNWADSGMEKVRADSEW